jgi:PAS domain S-box-containing protein
MPEDARGRESGTVGSADTRSGDRHSLLVEQLPLGIFSLDSDGNILEANPALLSIFGIASVKAARNINVLSFPPLLQAGIAQDVQRCLDTGDIVVADRPFVSKQDKSAFLQLRLIPVTGRQCTPIAVQGIVEDISEHVLTEELLREYQHRFEYTNLQLAKFSHAIEQSANIVVITDLKGIIEYVNPKFTEVTGYSADEVEGKNPRILKSGLHSDAFYKDLWQTITSGEQWRGEFQNRRKDGTLYWEQAAIAPVSDPTGRMSHFIAIKEDITERKRAEESLHHYMERLEILHEIDQSVLAAQLPETVAVAAIHRIRRLIPCQRVMVLSLGESGHTSLLAAASSGEADSVMDLDVYEEMLEQRPLGSGLVQGSEDLTEVAFKTPLQESLFEADMRSYVAVPLHIQSELVGTLILESTQPKAFSPDHIAIAIEVAASLAVAIRQARLYERAQQEIAERVQAEEILRQHTGELEARNAELDAFAHTVAHDLKSPVSSVVGYADVLRRNYATLPEDVQDEFLDVITRNSRKMASIIDELLLLSSVRGVGKAEMHPLEMGRIVAEARGRLLHLIEEHKGEIELPDSWPVAMGYGPWVEAVWANFISNALKYGGRPPRVELGWAVHADGWIRFWVRDNGQGLSAEEQARLFTPFERLHKVRAQGHGLGLSIVQRIVKKLGGQVGVASDGVPGAGCEFYFTLPALPTT